MARERCNELCTKATTGTCTLCDKLDEADEFIRFYFKGGWLLKAVNFYLVNFPQIIIFLALIRLAEETFSAVFDKDDFSSILRYYFAATALSVSFTSMTFAYARAQSGEANEELVVIGELFLYASLSLIVALLINWLCFWLKITLKKTAYYETFEIPLIIVAVLGNLYLVTAARCLSKGINKLDTRLRDKIGRLILFMGPNPTLKP